MASSTLPQAGQDDSEVVVGFQVVGLDFQGLAVLGDGLVDLPLGGQGVAQFMVHRSIPGYPLERDAKVLDGHVEVGLPASPDAEVAVQVQSSGALASAAS